MTAKAPSSVIAITYRDGQFLATAVRRRGQGVEVLWTRRALARDTNWKAFAADCGISVSSGRSVKSHAHQAVVLGVDSVGVGFLQVDVPEMPEPQMQAVVKNQVLARLPLGADQVAWTWRHVDAQDGQVSCVVATARKRYLYDFVERVGPIRADHTFLDCEAIVEIWKRAFGRDEQDGIIISLHQRSTLLCVAQKGRLIRSVTVDTGLSDIGLNSQEDGDQPDLRGRFLQDLQGALESLGAQHPVFILSDDTGPAQQVVAWLTSKDICPRAVIPIEKALTGVDQARVYALRIPLGLALMALDPSVPWLDLFQEFHEAETPGTSGVPRLSMRATAVLAALLLVVFLALLVVTDVVKERRLRAWLDQDTMKVRIAQRTMQKQVAQYRPDLLSLIDSIAGGDHPGIVLDSLIFDRGQPVRLKGHADQAEQMYQYHKRLIETKDIHTVKLEKPAKDKKTDKITFTITFHYRRFTTRNATF